MPTPRPASASPPSSPPAQKRAKLGEQSTTSEQAPSFSSAPELPPNGVGSSSSSGSNVQSTDKSVAPAEEESEDEEEQVVADKEEDVGRSDMYLDTVSRRDLDFDFERLCSKSLSNINVYGCLVCGKYFQGRGRGSWAYRHAVGENHRVWVNLATEKFYVLPEGYPVSDPSLQDIVHVLNPRYQSSALPALSQLPSPSYTLDGSPYLPGYIGLNNIKANDYLNVIIHLLLHVGPLRTFLLDPATPELQEERKPTELVKRLSALAKRLWNPRLFKSQASPHEFVQEVARRSNGKFKITAQGDPVEFLGWILNTLHRDLGGSKKRNSSIIAQTFQGQVRIDTQQIIVNKNGVRPTFDVSRDINTLISPFLFLSLDLPPMPLFQDLNEKKIIPQVSLTSILAKFNGRQTQEFGPTLKRHQLKALPKYLILHIKRFTKNNFVEEKNPTIVNFPLRGIDMAEYVSPQPFDHIESTYDLLANIPIDTNVASTSMSNSGPGSKKNKDDDGNEMAWKIHQRAGKGGGDGEKWFEMQDLRVQEVERTMVFLSETVLQIWERRDVKD